MGVCAGSLFDSFTLSHHLIVADRDTRPALFKYAARTERLLIIDETCHYDDYVLHVPEY